MPAAAYSVMENHKDGSFAVYDRVAGEFVAKGFATEAEATAHAEILTTQTAQTDHWLYRKVI